MRHLKNFTKLINEQEDMGNPSKSVIYAQSWEPTANEEGDYDVVWEDENGEPVTAVFRDMGGPIIEDGKMGFSKFETVEGTSSDGNEYVGEVRYQETGKTETDVFQIVSIIINRKV